MKKVKNKTSSAKRFGARYGKKIREKVGAIEKLVRTKYKCPYCNYSKVKRQAAGIWSCGKCKSIFTGRAYFVPKKTVIREIIKGSEASQKQVEEEEVEA